MGYPFFLRTGYGSGKHEWARTCFVPNPDVIPKHIVNLVEWSALVDFAGLPTNVWAVRELLETDAVFTAFLGMPIARERRYFISDGKVVCHHPYWPPDSIHSACQADWREAVDRLNVETRLEVHTLTHLSERVAAHFEGAWSLDWLLSRYGWYAIDMAEAGRSFHWPGCPTGDLA
jgi:hypothetical protein